MSLKWIELNLEVKPQDSASIKKVLVELVAPLVEEFKRRVSGERSWHYLWESDPWPLTLRLRFYGAAEHVEAFKALLEERLVGFRAGHPRLVGDYCYGRHGECGKVYGGEADTYGADGWRLVMRMLEFGAEVALELLANSSRYVCPLAPDEGSVLWIYADRYVHLFLNQLLLVDEIDFYLSQLVPRYYLYRTGLRPPEDWEKRAEKRVLEVLEELTKHHKE